MVAVAYDTTSWPGHGSWSIGFPSDCSPKKFQRLITEYGSKVDDPSSCVWIVPGTVDPETLL